MDDILPDAAALLDLMDLKSAVKPCVSFESRRKFCILSWALVARLSRPRAMPSAVIAALPI